MDIEMRAFFLKLIFIALILQLQVQMNNKKTLFIELKSEEKPNKLQQKFPSINFTSTSRALMSLSRRDKFDNQIQHLSAQLSKQIQSKSDAYEQLRPTRSTQYSMNKLRETQHSSSKVGKTIHFVKKFEREKIIPPSLKKLPKPGIQRFEGIEKQESGAKMSIKQQFCSLYNGQVKYCDKKFGCVDGYAISSHVGALSTGNNIRICVATNILRTSHKMKQVSFFGLFQGRNGANKAEYMRQYFHNTLINDQLFYYNFERAVSRTFEKIDRDFNYDPRFDGDYSVANSIMCIVLGPKLHLVKYGTPNATISMKFGSYIKTLVTQQKQGWLRQKKSMSTLSHYGQKLAVKQNIHIRSFDINNEYDFIILGNEGVYHSINHRNELGANVWKYMLDDHFHATSKLVGANKLARTCNKICEEAVRKDPFGRSMSMIIIQFSNMSSCFEESSDIQLPYVSIKKSMQTLDHDHVFKQDSSMQKQLMTQKDSIKVKNMNKNSFQMNPRYLKSFSNML